MDKWKVHLLTRYPKLLALLIITTAEVLCDFIWNFMPTFLAVILIIGYLLLWLFGFVFVCLVWAAILNAFLIENSYLAIGMGFIPASLTIYLIISFVEKFHEQAEELRRKGR